MDIISQLFYDQLLGLFLEDVFECFVLFISQRHWRIPMHMKQLKLPLLLLKLNPLIRLHPMIHQLQLLPPLKIPHNLLPIGTPEHQPHNLPSGGFLRYRQLPHFPFLDNRLHRLLLQSLLLEFLLAFLLEDFGLLHGLLVLPLLF